MILSVTPPAVADVDQILTYLRERSPMAADRLSARIDEVLKRLAEYPDLSRGTNRRSVRYVDILPFPYLIFYRRLEGEVQVIAVRHGARNPRSMPARLR